MARTRTVFGSHSNLAHVWAQQTHEYGKSGDGRMFFYGPTLHSYRTSYVIARFTDATLDGARVVLFNDANTYSISTNAHHRCAHEALRGLPVRCFSVPRPDVQWHEANVAAFVRAFEMLTQDYANPRKKIWLNRGDGRIEDTATNRADALAESLGELRDYCRAFSLPMPLVDLEAAQARITAAFAAYNDPAAAAKRAKAVNKRLLSHWRSLSAFYAWREGVAPMPNPDALPKRSEERRAVERVAYAYKPPVRMTLDDWLEGKGNSPALVVYSHTTYVRRVGDRLETSRGAVVPWRHAVAAFLRAQRCRCDATSWQRNGDRVTVGSYQLDSIDTEGNITAGCHQIEWAEMLRLAVREIPELVAPTFPVPVAA